MSPVVSRFAFGTLFLTLFAVFTPLLRKALDRVADPDPFLLAAMPCVALTGLFGFGAIEFGRAALGVEGVARYAVAAAAVVVTLGLIIGLARLMGFGRVARPETASVPIGAAPTIPN